MPPITILLARAKYSFMKDEGFLKEFGSLFEEFKNDRGVSSTLFYVLFCLRRLTYVFDLFFLMDYPAVQTAINAVWGAVVVGFLLFYKAFTPRRYLYLNVWLEVVCMSVFALSGVWLSNLGNELSYILVIGIVASVTSVFVATQLILVYDIFQICRRSKNSRGLTKTL